MTLIWVSYRNFPPRLVGNPTCRHRIFRIVKFYFTEVSELTTPLIIIPSYLAKLSGTVLLTVLAFRLLSNVTYIQSTSILCETLGEVFIFERLLFNIKGK